MKLLRLDRGRLVIIHLKLHHYGSGASMKCNWNVQTTSKERGRAKVGTTMGEGRDNVETTLELNWKKKGSFGKFLGLLIKNII